MARTPRLSVLLVGAGVLLSLAGVAESALPTFSSCVNTCTVKNGVYPAAGAISKSGERREGLYEKEG